MSKNSETSSDSSGSSTSSSSETSSTSQIDSSSPSDSSSGTSSTSQKDESPPPSTKSSTSGGQTINTNILDENFADQFNPDKDDRGFSAPFIKVIIPVVNKILSILQILGAVLLVLSIAIAGFNGLLGAGDGFSEDLGLSVGVSTNQYGNDVKGVQSLTKGALSKILRRLFIGVIIFEFSATIVKICFSIFTNI